MSICQLLLCFVKLLGSCVQLLKRLLVFSAQFEVVLMSAMQLGCFLFQSLLPENFLLLPVRDACLKLFLSRNQLRLGGKGAFELSGSGVKLLRSRVKLL